MASGRASAKRVGDGSEPTGRLPSADMPKRGVPGQRQYPHSRPSRLRDELVELLHEKALYDRLKVLLAAHRAKPTLETLLQIEALLDELDEM